MANTKRAIEKSLKKGPFYKMWAGLKKFKGHDVPQGQQQPEAATLKAERGKRSWCSQNVVRATATGEGHPIGTLAVTQECGGSASREKAGKINNSTSIHSCPLISHSCLQLAEFNQKPVCRGAELIPYTEVASSGTEQGEGWRVDMGSGCSGAQPAQEVKF